MRVAIAVFMLSLALVPPVSAAPRGDARGAAHCYFDRKTLTWRIGNPAIERTVQFDLATGGLRTLRLTAHADRQGVQPLRGAEGTFEVTPEGSDRPVQLSLQTGWALLWQSVGSTYDAGRVLTLHLQGTGPNKGWEVEAVYEAFPGSLPMLAKRLTLINRTGQTARVSRVAYDRFALTSQAPRRTRRSSPPDEVRTGQVQGVPTLIGPSGNAEVGAFVVGGGTDATGTAQGALGPSLDVQARTDTEVTGNGGRYLAPRSYVFVAPGGSTREARAVSERVRVLLSR